MPKLTVIVPVYNEVATVRRAIERLIESPCPIEREIIVVDDGSTDGSCRLIDQLAADHQLEVIHQPRRCGKGAAVHAAVRAATGDFIVVHDADFEYDPRDIARLLQPLLDDEADVVFGSRFRRERTQVHRTMHFLTNRLLTALSNLLSGIYLTDTHSCYKVYRADLLKAMRLRSPRFGFEAESTAYLAKVRARLMELPISYFPRTRTAGKKIGWRDGVEALGHLVYYNKLVSLERAFNGLPERYLPRE